MAEPQLLGQPDEHRAHEERLVPAVARVLDLQHHVATEQLGEVEGMRAVEEQAPHIDTPGRPDTIRMKM